MGDAAVVALVLIVAVSMASLAIGMVAVANAPQRIVARRTVELMDEQEQGIDWTPDSER